MWAILLLGLTLEKEWSFLSRFLLLCMCIAGFLVEVSSLFWYTITLRLLANDVKILSLENQGQMRVKMSKNSHKIDKNMHFDL